jgi:uncharacterized protein (TIGR02391 family)
VSQAAFPSPDEAAQLPLDEFSLRLLAYMRDSQRGHLQIRGIVNRAAWADHVEQADSLQWEKLLQEAWDWLYTRGLISGGDPTQSTDTWWTFITRRGYAALDEPDGPARLAAELRLAVDLHPLIAGRVHRQFLLGEYELAAIAALREVEIRVRALSGASDSDIGVRLMTDAFREGGRLHDESLDKGESESMMALFRGAIGVFKNPSSHRQVEFSDPTAASEVVLLADLLLRMLDQIETRLRVSAG